MAFQVSTMPQRSEGDRIVLLLPTLLFILATTGAATAGAAQPHDPQRATAREANEANEASEKPSSAPRAVVTIGYQSGIGFEALGATPTVATLMEVTFPATSYERRLVRFHRNELPIAVQRGLVDIGIIAVRPMATTQGDLPDEALLPTSARDVQTLPVTPAGFSVVTRPRQLGRQEEWAGASPYLVPLGGLLGVLALAVCAYLLNFRLPSITYDRADGRAGDIVVGSMNRVDPQLVALSRTTHWLLQTGRGRMMAALWAALGMGLSLLSIHGAAPVRHQRLTSASSLLEGPMRAAFPGAEVQELRDHWSRCLRPNDCLSAYKDEKVLALAGDREILCRYARLSQVTLEFEPGIAVPLQYAFLLPTPPNGTPTQATSRQASIRSALAHALRLNPPTKSPWAPCGASVSEK